jgi:hypothetical protein
MGVRDQEELVDILKLASFTSLQSLTLLVFENVRMRTKSSRIGGSVWPETLR